MSFICFGLATSSEKSGSAESQAGKYAVKIYTIDGVLIYQVEDGTTNINKTPKGGIIFQSSASSMLDAIANPITYYGGRPYTVINQSGHSGDLYNYYWSSYSRGVDGRHNPNEPQWHNVYLDGYIPLRVKSIYDPCPYLYRIPSHGTYNQFNIQLRWTNYSYLGGASWNMTTLGKSWFLGLGYRNPVSSIFGYTGLWGWYFSSTTDGQTYGYALGYSADTSIRLNQDAHHRSNGNPVRCIEGSLR